MRKQQQQEEEEEAAAAAAASGLGATAPEVLDALKVVLLHEVLELPAERLHQGVAVEHHARADLEEGAGVRQSGWRGGGGAVRLRGRARG